MLKLEPISYTGINAIKKNIGFIAQDVDNLFPGLLTSKSEEDDYWSLDYSLFSVIAIKALQEQQEIITNLQKQVDELQKITKDLQKN